MTLALSRPPSNNVAMVAIADSASKHGSAYNINLIVVHVILGAVATMLFLPSGIVIPRYARGLVTARWWFPLHLAVQGLGAVAGLGALGTAFSLGGAGGSAHQLLAVILAVGMGLQVALGIFVHWYKARPHRFQSSSGRGPSNFVHMILGVLIVVFGWATTWTGMDDEWGIYSGKGGLSAGWKVGWGVIVALFTLAYVIGLVVFLPRQRRLERVQREGHGLALQQSYTGVDTPEDPMLRTGTPFLKSQAPSSLSSNTYEMSQR